MSLKRPIRIGIVAAELSGDILGAGLIAELKKQKIAIEFVGIGGPKMLQEGLCSLVLMENLSVMGISDVLLQYFKLRKIFNLLLHAFKNNPPDIFIGIDYSYFNLMVSAHLKKSGVKTVQYVSPKIWAWRQKRVFKIKKAVDLVLTLFPFEKAFYDQYDVPAVFVGHPLADYIALHTDFSDIKKDFGYAPDDKVIAVLPGSRLGEIKYMGPLFLDVMHEISLSDKEMHFIVPMANSQLKQAFEAQLRTKGYHLNIQLIDGQSRNAMVASNVVILKTGTCTLEAMLLKRPMVVAYKFSALTYAIIGSQLKIPYISLPNLLANQEIVPEFFQKNALAKPIAAAALSYFKNEAQDILMKTQFKHLHHQLHQCADKKAANAILDLIH